jgi:hypothetical protein
MNLEQKIKENGWDWVLVNTKVPLEVLKFYINEFDSGHWYSICCFQELDEDFIESNIDKIYWDNISLNQYLSVDFITKYNSKINHNLLRYNTKIDPNNPDRFDGYNNTNPKIEICLN